MGGGYGDTTLTSGLPSDLEDTPRSLPAWRGAGLNRRWRVSGATLGGHGEGHLLLLVFGQSSLHRLGVDVCKDQKMIQYTLDKDAGKKHDLLIL